MYNEMVKAFLSHTLTYNSRSILRGFPSFAYFLYHQEEPKFTSKITVPLKHPSGNVGAI
jgi:hypothetical protein